MTSAPPGTVLAVAPDQSRREPADLLASAADCARVGAAVVDLLPRAGLAAAVAALRERTELLVRVTAHARDLALTELLDTAPHVVCCPLGAPPEFAAELRAGAAERGIAVHHEVSAPADLDALARLDEPGHVVLVLGERLPGDVPGFAAALQRLPQGTGCTAAGRGEAALPVLLTALAAGCHVRTGTAEHPGRDDAQLAARAAGLAKIARRPPVPPAQAARLLGIKT